MTSAGKPGPGFLVTFEGPEGGGKSTQADQLAASLREAGYQVCATREPGGTQTSEAIRDILLGRRGAALSPWTEALLFTAARAQLIEELIRPALAMGQVVVSDRFSDSTLAYQGHGRGLDLDVLRQLQLAATGGLRPALTFLLDLPVDEGLHRIQKRALDRLDRESVRFHERVRNAYLQMAAAETDRWVVIDARRPPDDQARSVLETTLRRLRGAGVRPAERRSA